MTSLDQLRSECLHRRIFCLAVPVRHHDGHRNAESRRGETNRLPMITASGGHHAPEVWLGASEVIEVDEPAANLERPHRSVILVLDPDARSAARVEQRPALLRRWRHRRIHHTRRKLEISEAFNHVGGSLLAPGSWLLAPGSWPDEGTTRSWQRAARSYGIHRSASPAARHAKRADARGV